MEIAQFQNGIARCVSWSLADTGWDDLARTFDTFLSEAISVIAAECPDGQFNWLEICLWDTRLLVYPSEKGPMAGEPKEPIYYQLEMGHIRSEQDKIDRSGTLDNHEDQLTALSLRVWARVEECLQTGKTYGVFTAARAQHRFKVAGFDYDPHEGIFRLSAVDPAAFEQMRNDYRRWFRENCEREL
jgi:hypothetical protein